MNKQKLMLLFGLGLLLMTACSTTGSTELTTTTEQAVTTTAAPAGSQISIEPVPPPELDPSLTGPELLVAVEARWMCDVQRYAFPDLASLNRALDQRLTPYGLSRSDYDAFKVELETRIDLREQVLAEYDGYCTGD